MYIHMGLCKKKGKKKVLLPCLGNKYLNLSSMFGILFFRAYKEQGQIILLVTKSK